MYVHYSQSPSSELSVNQILLKSTVRITETSLHSKASDLPDKKFSFLQINCPLNVIWRFCLNCDREIKEYDTNDSNMEALFL